MIIDYYDVKMIFEIFELINSLKFKKIRRFWRKQGTFTENFAKEPTIFLFPKFLELFLTPENTQGLKLKNGLNEHFFVSPCIWLYFVADIKHAKKA